MEHVNKIILSGKKWLECSVTKEYAKIFCDIFVKKNIFLKYWFF